MLNEILDNKIMPMIELILQGDVKTIVSVFGMLFIAVLVFTVYIDIHNMLKETIKTIYPEYLMICSKYMLLPILSLIGLFSKEYPLELMNEYSLFVRMVCFFWSLLLIEYVFTGIIYIIKTKQNTPKIPKIRR